MDVLCVEGIKCGPPSATIVWSPRGVVRCSEGKAWDAFRQGNARRSFRVLRSRKKGVRCVHMQWRITMLDGLVSCALACFGINLC